MDKKILLIEDEKMLAEMYKDRFTQAGYQVDLAFSAEQGLEMLKEKKQRPDLILLDILLPRGNGIFFLEQKVKISQAESIPVVAFSNYDDAKTRKEAKKLGVKEYLIKTDYTPDEIVRKVEEYLD